MKSHKPLIKIASRRDRAISKENIWGNRYMKVLDNFTFKPRPPSRFRNVMDFWFNHIKPKPSEHKRINQVKLNETKIAPRFQRLKSVVGSKKIITKSLNNSSLLNKPAKYASVTTLNFKYKSKDVWKIVQKCEDYSNDINKYLHSIEDVDRIKFEYMENQREVTNSMRAILIDWLIDVHEQFKLLPETLFLTVNIIDRYLSKVQVSKESFQLIGIVSTLIASKYEEIYPPGIKDFSLITNRICNKKQILDTEKLILHELNFNLTIPSSYNFMKMFFTKLNANKRMEYLAQYFLELCLVNGSINKYKSSEIAAGSLFVANSMIEETSDEKIGIITGYLEPQLKLHIKEIIKENNKLLQAATKKFAKEKYMNVSQIPILNKENLIP